MALQYDQAPEVAPDTYPEVHIPPGGLEVNPNGPLSSFVPLKPEENSTINQAHVPISPQGDNSPYGYGASTYQRGGAVAPDEPEKRKASRGPCGCSLLVFILSVIIALLSVAVVGLAAGTGVASNRANEKQSQLDALRVSGDSLPTVTTTVTAASATPTGADAADRGCSTDSEDVTGTNYTTQFFDRATYQIYCNTDTPNDPIYSLFVGTFGDCIDACAHWAHYIPEDFNVSSTRNKTCQGLSYIPLWTNRTSAFDGGAPGNCYLKPGPQNETALRNPNAGTAVHAAILVS